MLRIILSYVLIFFKLFKLYVFFSDLCFVCQEQKMWVIQHKNVAWLTTFKHYYEAYSAMQINDTELLSL